MKQKKEGEICLERRIIRLQGEQWGGEEKDRITGTSGKMIPISPGLHIPDAPNFPNTEPTLGVLQTSYQAVSPHRVCVLCVFPSLSVLLSDGCFVYVLIASRLKLCWGDYMQRISADSLLIPIIMSDNVISVSLLC